MIVASPGDDGVNTTLVLPAGSVAETEGEMLPPEACQVTFALPSPAPSKVTPTSTVSVWSTMMEDRPGEIDAWTGAAKAAKSTLLEASPAEETVNSVLPASRGASTR